MNGAAKKLWICGKKIALGDYVEVEYTSGIRMKGGQIKGTVTELWNPEDHAGHHQARLSCGWCFHPGDKILIHIPSKRRNDEIL